MYPLKKIFSYWTSSVVIEMNAIFFSVQKPTSFAIFQEPDRIMIFMSESAGPNLFPRRLTAKSYFHIKVD